VQNKFFIFALRAKIPFYFALRAKIYFALYISPLKGDIYRDKSPFIGRDYPCKPPSEKIKKYYTERRNRKIVFFPVCVVLFDG
jgi:hypothetical protein